MATAEFTKQVVDPGLVLDSKVIEDNSIQERTFVSYPPTSATTLGVASGDIRMHINQTDQFTGIYDSWLRFEAQFKRTAALLTQAEQVAPIHNALYHLFSVMRLELNGQEVERIEDPGVILTMVQNALATVDDDVYGLDSCFKLDTSYRKTGGTVNVDATGTAQPVDGVGPSSAYNIGADLSAGQTTAKSEGWHERKQFISRNDTNTGDNVGKATFRIPLSKIFSFARDYTKYLYGYSYTLVLTRKDAAVAARIALQGNAAFTRTDLAVSLDKVEWVVPHCRPSLEIQDKLYRQILDKVEYPIAFRQQRSAKYQTPNTNSFTWNASSVNISSEKPLYALISFVRNTRFSNGNNTNLVRDNAALFDDPNMSDIAIYANGVRIPLETQSYQSNTLNIAGLYADFQDFKHKFLGLPAGVRSPISFFDFKLLNMCYVFDLTRLPEQFRSGTVNLTVKAMTNGSAGFAELYTAHMVLFTKQVMMARSDGTRFTLVRQ